MSDLLLLLDNGDADLDVGEVPGGSAVAGPTFDAFGGPAADTWEPRGRVEVWQRDGTFVGTVGNAYAVTWQERPYDDPGTASFTIQNDDPDLALCTTGRVARFLLDGEVRFAALIRKRFKTALSRAEESGQATRVDCDGTLAVLASAIVLPGRTLSDATAGTRVFGFASTTLPSSTPPPPVAQVTQPVVDEPVNFPVNTGAQWVTPETVTATGEATFRQSFTVAAPQVIPLTLHIAVTAPFTCWVDGQVVVSSPRDYVRTQFLAPLRAGVGDHVIAVVTSTTPLTGPDAVLAMKYAVIGVTQDGLRAAVIAVSTNVAVPAQWTEVTAEAVRPARWTAGSIMLALIDEAVTRGCFPDLVTTFTETVDTDGTAWPQVTELTVNVFNDLGMVVKQLAESGWGHFAMAPGAQVLNGYAAPGESTASVMTAGGNIAELTHETVG